MLGKGRNAYTAPLNVLSDMANTDKVRNLTTLSGVEIRGCHKPRVPLNSPASLSNFCREPKEVLGSIQNTFWWLFKMLLGALEKSLISSPEYAKKDLK